MQESDCDTSDLPPKLLLKGLDSLYVSFYLNRPEVNWEELGYQKERLREEADVQFLGLQLAGEDWSLQPYGHYPYKVILSNETFELRLAEYMQPNCYLVVRSEALWTYGLDQLEERINRLVNELSPLGRCEAETVSRADWAFDFQLSQVDFQETDFLTRAAKSAKWNEHGKTQTFQFGIGNVVVRVYDKVAEIEQKSGKAWLYEIWGTREDVWRVEFQVRGPRLKFGNIRTLEDLRTYQADLLHELAENHTSLRTRATDTNRSRWELHPLWQSLLEQIQTLPRHGVVRSIDPAKSLSWSLHKQICSVYGSLKGIAATRAALDEREAVPSLNDVIEYLASALKYVHRPPLWQKEIEQRLGKRRLGQ